LDPCSGEEGHCFVLSNLLDVCVGDRPVILMVLLRTSLSRLLTVLFRSSVSLVLLFTWDCVAATGAVSSLLSTVSSVSLIWPSEEMSRSPLAIDKLQVSGKVATPLRP
jgi:hypothetical protein